MNTNALACHHFQDGTVSGITIQLSPPPGNKDRNVEGTGKTEQRDERVQEVGIIRGNGGLWDDGDKKENVHGGCESSWGGIGKEEMKDIEKEMAWRE